MNLNETSIYLLLHMAKSHSVTHTQVLNILPLFELFTTFYITTLILYSHLFNFTSSIPITPSDTENYLPSDDLNITNLMVSHYDCAKQHNSTLNTQVLKPVYMSEQRLNTLKLLNVLLMQKKKERFAFKVP